MKTVWSDKFHVNRERFDVADLIKGFGYIAGDTCTKLFQDEIALLEISREELVTNALRGRSIVIDLQKAYDMCVEAKRKENKERHAACAKAKELGDGMHWITICWATSCYGGPEEGGWSYTLLEPLGSYATTLSPSRELEKRIEQYLLKTHAPHSRRYRGKACGGCDDDTGMTKGSRYSSHDEDEIEFEYTYGAPYVWGGRPHYE